MLAQDLARPLWDRCLRLTATACDALLGAPPDSAARLHQSFVDILDRAPEPDRLKLLAQLPLFLETLMRARGGGGDLAGGGARASSGGAPAGGLLCDSKWFAAKLRQGGPESQACAAYAAGLVAKLVCAPGAWRLCPGLCPRPLLLRPRPALLAPHAADPLPPERWRFLEALSKEVASGAVEGGVRAELARGLVGALASAPRAALAARADTLPRAAARIWRFLLDPATPALRMALASEAGALTCDGAKVRVH